MAHYAKTISFSLIIVFFLSLLQVDARDSKFFSKVTPTTTATRTATTNNVIEPEGPQLAPVPEPALAPMTTTTTTATTADEILKEELGERYEEEEEEKWSPSPYNNKNGYTTTTTTNNYYNTNGYSENYKNGNGYVSQKQGMSDTRFMENGKYYYNVKNENYYNGYESEKGIGSEGYYNGNKENEFDSMEEYERQQGYPESQGEYVP
ncbi:protein E6-like [Actinidia eriantha]|uniref:protein E6-like n=1 Tax=Actinidia eriantha TaxID=165200 RepID=UPI0025871B2E|nr:protein E6-like [Actinidia eriantha]